MSIQVVGTHNAKSSTIRHFNMSNPPDTQKTLEVKIRPYSGPNNQERPDQKGVSRVHMCKEALMDLRIEAGQPIYLCKDGQNQEERREAIAWPTAEKALSKKVVQMSKTFQEVCGYKLGDDLKISAAGPLREAESIVLRDLTAEEPSIVPELGDEDKSHWVWFLRESLGR